MMKRIRMLFGTILATIAAIAQTNPGTIQDSEGNTYRTLQYGDQIWTIDNWRCSRFSDCTDLAFASSDSDWSAAGNTGTPAYCFPDGNSSMSKDCGYLYNYYVVDPANPKKIYPERWRVPTVQDWEKLMNYLIQQGYNYDGSNSTVASNKLGKSMAKIDHPTRLWTTNTTEGNVGNIGGTYVLKQNASLFSAIPCGFRRDTGAYASQLSRSYFHSSGLLNNTIHTYYYISYDGSKVTSATNFTLMHGYPIRLVRDVSAPLMNVPTKKCADCP